MQSRNTKPTALAPRTTVEMAEHAANQIRDAIIAGTLKPGERLVEIELSTQLQVSRHPIREALRRLAREGFVDIRPNRGAIVAGVEPMSILEVYELRMALGTMALRHLLAPGRLLAAEDLKRLEQMAQKAVRFAARDQQPEMVTHDLAFQAAIVELSGLPRVANYFRELGAELHRFINLLRIDYADKEATARREVLGLFEAIRDLDLARAEAIWSEKFTLAAHRLLSVIPGAERQATSDPQWSTLLKGKPNRSTR